MLAAEAEEEDRPDQGEPDCRLHYGITIPLFTVGWGALAHLLVLMDGAKRSVALRVTTARVALLCLSLALTHG
jgi:hypothetical protein